jgi:hypothetical protein
MIHFDKNLLNFNSTFLTDVSYNQALFASLGFNYKKSKKLTFVSIIKYFVRYFYPG